MLRGSYTKGERDYFFQMKNEHNDKRIRRRYDVLWLHSCGKFVPEIVELTRFTKVTVRRIIKRYLQKGKEGIETIKAYRPKSVLTPYRDAISHEFEERPPKSSKEAAARIAELFGIQLSSQRVRTFMKELGFEFRKVGTIPAKANLADQEEFLKKLYLRR
jgi:transposase